MRNPFTKLVNSVKNFFSGMRVEKPTFIPKKQEAVPYKPKRTHFPAWWTVLFGLPNPNKLALNKRVVKHQGSFKPIRPLGMTKKERIAWEAKYIIKRGRK